MAWWMVVSLLMVGTLIAGMLFGWLIALSLSGTGSSASPKRIALSSESGVWARLEDLESTLKRLRLDWLDTYEKLVKVAGRIDRSRGMLNAISSSDSSPSSTTSENETPGNGSRAEVLKQWRLRGRRS